MAIRFFLRPLGEDVFGNVQYGYDVQILQPQASLGQYLQQIEAFQAQTLADCRGCDGCCHERAPLTIADWALSGQLSAPLGQWLGEWGELSFWGRAVDLTIKRDEQGNCHFLEQEQKCCRIHPRRGFTCRSHCCLPKSQRAEALRGELINAGEDELVRRMLLLPPEQLPPGWAQLLADAQCRAEDYLHPALAQTQPAAWGEIPLKEIVNPRTWAMLLAEA